MKNEVFNVGVDLGNGFTNYLSQRNNNEGQRFMTRIEVMTNNAFKNQKNEIHKVEIGGKKYKVGTGISLEIKDTAKRINSNEYKIALLTAIAKSLPRTGYAEVNLVVGLPVSYLESYADELEEIIRGWGKTELIVDDERFEIKIRSVQVFAEGALSMLVDLTNDDRVLTIDMGSGTVDCIEFIDGEPERTYTVTSSMNDIYSKVADRLKSSEFKMKFNTDDIEKIIGKTTINYNRKDVDISSHFEDIDLGVQRICNDISAYYGGFEQFRRVILLGGASILTHAYWEKKVDGIELTEDAQYVNAKVFQLIAESN